MLKGYDQIEFTRTKAPYAVNACRGSKRLHLHVDWYGKVTVTDKTPAGSCPTEAENTVETEAEPKTTKTEAGNEQSTISAASLERDKTVEENTVATETEPKDETERTDCKKFFPTIGRSLTVACEQAGTKPEMGREAWYGLARGGGMNCARLAMASAFAPQVRP